jgi:hypothetical protein
MLPWLDSTIAEWLPSRNSYHFSSNPRSPLPSSQSMPRGWKESCMSMTCRCDCHPTTATFKHDHISTTCTLAFSRSWPRNTLDSCDSSTFSPGLWFGSQRYVQQGQPLVVALCLYQGLAVFWYGYGSQRGRAQDGCIGLAEQIPSATMRRDHIVEECCQRH